MRARRRRRSEPTPISVLLSRWVSRRGLEEQLMQYELWVRWPELVGERLAAHAEPGLLKKGRLTICVGSAAWLNELAFLRGDLMARINAGLGHECVREVKLQAGPVRRRPPPASAEAPVARSGGPAGERLPDPLLAEAEHAAAAVDDESLREAVRRAGLARLRYKP